MSELFEHIEPGLYRCAGLKLETDVQAKAWTAAFDDLLATSVPFILIIDRAQQPTPVAGKVFTLWLKANRCALSKTVKRVIYVIEDSQERAILQERSLKAAAAMPYPTEIVASLEEAMQRAWA